MIIAFPNLYSFPYKFRYKLLKLGVKWQFPDVQKIFDLNIELENNGLILIERKVVAKNTNLNWFKSSSIKFTPLFHIFKILDKLFKFEGYLTVLIIRKMN